MARAVTIDNDAKIETKEMIAAKFYAMATAEE
jgi:hypothetical protein